MFKKIMGRGGKAESKANAAKATARTTAKAVKIKTKEKKMGVTLKEASAIAASTFSQIMSNTPKSVVRAWIAIAKEDTGTAAFVLLMGIAATMAPKKIIEPKVLALGIKAMPSELTTGSGINHRGWAILGHAVMLILGELMEKQPALVQVVVGYRMSMNGAKDIKAFGSGGLIPGATGKKLERQGLLRKYATMPWEDIEVPRFTEQLKRVKGSFAQLAANTDIVWVRVNGGQTVNRGLTTKVAQAASVAAQGGAEAKGDEADGSEEEEEEETTNPVVLGNIDLAQLKGYADLDESARKGLDVIIAGLAANTETWMKNMRSVMVKDDIKDVDLLTVAAVAINRMATYIADDVDAPAERANVHDLWFQLLKEFKTKDSNGSTEGVMDAILTKQSQGDVHTVFWVLESIVVNR